MDLHELFDSVLDDLPPMPDQTAAATDSLRRHRIRVRYGLLASACALVIGAGTLSIAAPWRHTGTTVTSADHPSKSAQPTPSPDLTSQGLTPAFAQYVVSAIQSVWPVAGVHVSRNGSPERHTVGDLGLPLEYEIGGKTYAGAIDFRRWVNAAFDACSSMPPFGESGANWSCTTTSLPGGMVVKIEHYGPSAASTTVQLHLLSGAEDLDLTIDAQAAHGISDAQLLALAKSPAYQQLFVQAQQRGLLEYDAGFDGWPGG